MARQHVDHEKVGTTEYQMQVQWGPVDDGDIVAGPCCSEDEALALGKKLMVERDGGWLSVRRGTYEWDPDLDFEEVQWVSFVDDEEYRIEGWWDHEQEALVLERGA